MSKAPSIETQLRTVKRELAKTKSELATMRARANRAESEGRNLIVERDEWKKRFDELLRKMPRTAP